MVFIKYVLLLAFLLSAAGCHIGYITKNAYHQARLLQSRRALEDVLADDKIDDDTKRKLKLAHKAKIFAETHLKLEKTKNYESYVDLQRPYVTYVVSAAPKDKLEFYKWYFPIIGSVPYKGYFNKQGAKKESQSLQKDNYDTYVRGVTAYSTLGWFKDPILSSMLKYSDYNLVNTIIHETVHATIYIKDNANFNERLATYLGDLGTSLFYKKENLSLNDIKKKIADSSFDQKIFSSFISSEIKSLGQWYGTLKDKSSLEELRQKRFQSIQSNFAQNILPKMKTKRYHYFSKAKINNAYLLNYKLYMNDLSDFEKLTELYKGDFSSILSYLKSLEGSASPEAKLKEHIKSRKMSQRIKPHRAALSF